MENNNKLDYSQAELLQMLEKAQPRSQESRLNKILSFIPLQEDGKTPFEKNYGSLDSIPSIVPIEFDPSLIRKVTTGSDIWTIVEKDAQFDEYELYIRGFPYEHGDECIRELNMHFANTGVYRDFVPDPILLVDEETQTNIVGFTACETLRWLAELLDDGVREEVNDAFDRIKIGIININDKIVSNRSSIRTDFSPALDLLTKYKGYNNASIFSFLIKIFEDKIAAVKRKDLNEGLLPDIAMQVKLTEIADEVKKQVKINNAIVKDRIQSGVTFPAQAAALRFELEKEVQKKIRQSKHGEMYYISILSTDDLSSAVRNRVERYCRVWNIQFNNAHTFSEVEGIYTEEAARNLSSRKLTQELRSAVRDLKKKLFAEYWNQFIQSDNPDAKLDFNLNAGKRSSRFPEIRAEKIERANVDRNGLLAGRSSIS